MIARLLGRVFGWEHKPDEIPPTLARALAAHVVAGMPDSAFLGPVPVGWVERRLREERDRARRSLMLVGAMLANGTHDAAALESLEQAGRIFRGKE